MRFAGPPGGGGGGSEARRLEGCRKLGGQGGRRGSGQQQFKQREGAPALLPYLQIPSNDDQQLTLTGRPIRRQPVQHPGIASVATPSGARLSPAATLYIQTLPDHPASARLSLPSFQLPVQPRRAYIPCERCDVTPVVIHTNHDSVPLLAITPARRAT